MINRPWVRVALLFVLLVVLFLVVNRGAYQGYFFGDDIDNVMWTPYVKLGDFATALISPVFTPNNFRPVGHFYFRALAGAVGRNYPWYVAGLHIFHLLNVWLLYLLLRRMKLDWIPAASGALFFAFQMAVFDALWKPMYIFDVLCGTFCLLSLLAYAARRYGLSFLCMWLAYKAKEPAIGLPVLLAMWEWWFGEKRWKQLLPFFAFSALFGVQALFHRPEIGSVYRLRFTPQAFLESAAYYSSIVFFVPFAGLGTLALPFLFRDRRVWLGVAGFWILLAPMLFLPSRLFPAYVYVPLIALSIAAAGIAAERRLVWIAIFFALWLPVNHFELRKQRKSTLAFADENRRYVAAAADWFRDRPGTGAAVIDGDPESLNRWGTESAIRLVSGKGNGLLVRHFGDANAHEALDKPDAVVFSWDRHLRRVSLRGREPGGAPTAWIEAGKDAPLWLFRVGWHERNGAFRWIDRVADVAMHRPAGAGVFRMRVNALPEPASVEVVVDGKPLGVRQFTGPGIREAQWSVATGEESDVTVELRVDSPYRGVPVMAFGFVVE